MTQRKPKNIQAYDNALEDYAMGQLSPAKHLLIKCQKDISEEVAKRIKLQENVASLALDDVAGEPLSPFFLRKVLADLPLQDDRHFKVSHFENDNESEINFEQLVTDLKWRGYIPGFAVHNVIGSRQKVGEDRLYLFKGDPGAKISEHSHSGEEWTLVLKGGYTANGEIFKKGDIHIVADNEKHSLQVMDDEDCISLVMTKEFINMADLLPQTV